MAEGHALDTETSEGWFERCRKLLAPRARTWAITVPLHIVAFLVLYFATARLLEREVILAASDTSEEQLKMVATELLTLAAAHAIEGGPKSHAFDALLGSHRSIHLKLLLPDGSVLGPEPGVSRAEHDAMREFLPADEEQRTWFSQEGESKRVRGLVKVIATGTCTQCHQGGSTLAIASMRVELTPLLDRIHTHARRNLGLLILAWAGALGVISVVVKRSVEKSANRLQAELAAAETGTSHHSSGETGELVLDPASAQLHRSLREFLARQRHTREEMTSRLAHTDQLATAGELAAGLAHEIKNPLAGIQGALEILREDTSDESTRQLHDQMLGELERVNATLQTLLSSARPSPPHLADTELGELLQDLRHFLGPDLRRRQISLGVELPPEPLYASIDPAKIRQVLVNLIKNAAEAIEQEGTITLRAGSFPEQADGVIITVEDNGPGISEEDQNKIFETFFTTKFSGTGLGLAIARRLVEQHGGSLEVESEPGKGTTFYLLLPDARTEPEPLSAIS